MEWQTIRVPKRVYEDAKERKEHHGVTWGEYVNPHSWHSVFDEPADAPDGEAVTVDKDLSDVLERLDRNLDAIKEATNSAQSAERSVEQLENHR